MAKINILNIASGYNINFINTNFANIKTALENQVYYRNNPVGEVNTLETDMDVNSRLVYNLPTPTLPTQAASKSYVDNQLGTANLQSYVTAAAAQATIATTQAGNALTQAGNALTQANLAAASYDSFDDRYLGPKASAPTLDNDGNALLNGALYWNTPGSKMYSWNGTAWQDITSATALTKSAIVTALGFTPVQQGTGTSQTAAADISLGQSTIDGTKVRLMRGATDMGNVATETYAAATYYSNTGGVISGSITVTNGNGLYGRDTGGTARQMISYGADNNINCVNGTGGFWRLYNNTGAAVIAEFNNAGTLNLKQNLVLENSGSSFQMKDTGNTIRDHIYMASSQVIVRVSGGTNILWYNQAGTTQIAALSNAGDFQAVTVTQTSDDRKKKAWKPLTKAQLDALAEVTSGTFEWIATGERSVGGSAQEIQAIVPEAVHTNQDGELSVNYGGLNFAILQAMLRKGV